MELTPHVQLAGPSAAKWVETWGCETAEEVPNHLAKIQGLLTNQSCLNTILSDSLTLMHLKSTDNNGE